MDRVIRITFSILKIKKRSEDKTQSSSGETESNSLTFDTVHSEIESVEDGAKRQKAKTSSRKGFKRKFYTEEDESCRDQDHPSI